VGEADVLNDREEHALTLSPSKNGPSQNGLGHCSAAPGAGFHGARCGVSNPVGENPKRAEVERGDVREELAREEVAGPGKEDTRALR
jgi:hypothetical protein